MNRAVSSFVAFVFAAPLFVACGLQISQSGTPSSTHPDAGGGNGCYPAGTGNYEIPPCAGCNGSTVSAQCINGAFVCPTYDCPVQEPDAGPGCSLAEPLPSCPASDGCSAWQIQCVENQWACVDVSGVCAPDSGIDAPDDAPVIYDSGPFFFGCGGLPCNRTTSYCLITQASDAGPIYACDLLPSACQPGAATCACMGIIGQGCSCADPGDDVTMTCSLP